MIDKASKLRIFQREFGDYIRKQNTIIPIPCLLVGQLYQNLIYNNVSGFVNQCFPLLAVLLRRIWHIGLAKSD